MSEVDTNKNTLWLENITLDRAFTRDLNIWIYNVSFQTRPFLAPCREEWWWEVGDRDHILHLQPQEVVRRDSRLIVIAFVVTEVTYLTCIAEEQLSASTYQPNQRDFSKRSCNQSPLCSSAWKWIYHLIWTSVLGLSSVKITFWLLLWSKYKNWTLICLSLKHPPPPPPSRWGQFDCFGLIFYSGDHKMIPGGEDWGVRTQCLFVVCGAGVGFVKFQKIISRWWRLQLMASFMHTPHYESSSLFMLYLQVIINLQLSLVKQAVNAGGGGDVWSSPWAWESLIILITVWCLNIKMLHSGQVQPLKARNSD